MNCTALKEIEILDSVVNIKEDAFSGCKSLVNVRIPPSVESIGSNAFFLCIKG